MSTKVYVSVVLREHCGGRSTFEIDAESVRGVVKVIDLEYPGFYDNVFHADGSINKTIRISVNGENVTTPAGPDTMLRQDDRIFLLYAIAGG
jgi:molybdopterin converting factor small subunit